MRIEQYLDVINACRFCFMCRHLSPVGNVTFREADTPRGRALFLDRVRMQPSCLQNPDYITALYATELSAACRLHCVNHYDEVGMVLAARRDVVESGMAPPKIKELAMELGKVSFQTKGVGDVLYYIDPYTELRQPEISRVFRRLVGDCVELYGGDTGKALLTLGFADEANKVAKQFHDMVKSSGCRTLVTSCPASYHALINDFPMENVKVLHSSEFLLACGIAETKAGKAYYLDSDYLKNYCGNISAPRDLLRALGYELHRFGTNIEESYGVGEGAVVYDRINPVLMGKLCARVCELVDDMENDLLVTSSPYAKYALKSYSPNLNVISLEEAIAKAKGGVACH